MLFIGNTEMDKLKKIKELKKKERSAFEKILWSEGMRGKKQTTKKRKGGA